MTFETIKEKSKAAKKVTRKEYATYSREGETVQDFVSRIQNGVKIDGKPAELTSEPEWSDERQAWRLSIAISHNGDEDLQVRNDVTRKVKVQGYLATSKSGVTRQEFEYSLTTAGLTVVGNHFWKEGDFWKTRVFYLAEATEEIEKVTE